MSADNRTSTRKGNSRRARIMLNLSIVLACVVAMSVAIVFMLVNTTVVNADAWNAKGQRQLDTITPIQRCAATSWHATAPSWPPT